MLRVSFARVKPEKEQRLRDWLAELMTRQQEVRQSFAQEGARQEQAFILPTSDGPIFVHVMEAEDTERAFAAYGESGLPIDAQNRAVLAETLAERLLLWPQYDCHAIPTTKDTKGFT
jgi:hypothetical protein